MQGLVEKTSEAEITNSDFTARRNHDVCWFQVTVKNPIAMKVLTPIEELKHDAFDSRSRDGMPRRLCVVMNYL
jgi:hypothetical protein